MKKKIEHNRIKPVFATDAGKSALRRKRDNMRKKIVATAIWILLLTAILLGAVRYWMLGQRQTAQERGTLVQICGGFEKERAL